MWYRKWQHKLMTVAALFSFILLQFSFVYKTQVVADNSTYVDTEHIESTLDTLIRGDKYKLSPSEIINNLHGTFKSDELLVLVGNKDNVSTVMKKYRIKGYILTARVYNKYIVTIHFDKNILEMFNLLNEDPNILYVEPNYIKHFLAYTPDDPEYANGNQWYLDSATNGGINMPDAWEYVLSQIGNEGGDKNTVVAILDSGLNWEDITYARGNVVTADDVVYKVPSILVNTPTLWTTSDCDYDGVNDDGNDLGWGDVVDDCHGFDAYSYAWDTTKWSDFLFLEYANEHGRAYDEIGHGTAIASIIAQQTNDTTGGAGIADNITLLPISINDENGFIELNAELWAMEYAKYAGADIINMSFGGPGYSVLEHLEIVELSSEGILLVAASGNDGGSTKFYPAACPEVLSVGAVKSDGSRVSYSQYGDWLDITAPAANTDNSKYIWTEYLKQGMGSEDALISDTTSLSGWDAANSSNLELYSLDYFDAVSFSGDASTVAQARYNPSGTWDLSSISTSGFLYFWIEIRDNGSTDDFMVEFCDNADTPVCNQWSDIFDGGAHCFDTSSGVKKCEVTISLANPSVEDASFDWSNVDYINFVANNGVAGEGKYIFATNDTDFCGIYAYDFGSYETTYVQGTSFAAPQVVGVAALVKSLHPDWTGEQIACVLKKTARDVGSAGRDDYTGYGVIDANSAVRSDLQECATSWYFAEGYTDNGFKTYLLLMNPEDTDASVQVSFLREGTSPIVKHYTVAAHSRFTIKAFEILQEGFGIEVKSLNGVNIYAERAMYWKDYSGGHDTVGVDNPKFEWYLAEGWTGGDFKTYILIMNPNDFDINVDATFMFEDGTTQTKTYTVGARKRYVIKAHELFTDKGFSAYLSSIDGQFVVERAMYWKGYDGGHDTIGLTELKKDWYLAEGWTGGGFKEYILLMNPNDSDVSVKLRFMFEDGSVQEKSYTMKAHSRFTVKAHELYPGKGFSVQVIGNNDIVVERAMYWKGYDGGHDTIGLTELKKDWYLAEGWTGGGFKEYILLMNPNDSDVSVRLRFMFEDGSVQEKSYTMKAHSRFTVKAHELYPGKGFSVQVIGNNDIAVERAMYWDGYDGGHDTIGM